MTPFGVLRRQNVSYYFSGDEIEKFIEVGFKLEPHPQGDYLVVVWPNGRKEPVLGRLSLSYKGLRTTIYEKTEGNMQKDLPSGNESITEDDEDSEEVKPIKSTMSDEEFIELAKKHRKEIIKMFAVPSLSLQKGRKKK